MRPPLYSGSRSYVFTNTTMAPTKQLARLSMGGKAPREKIATKAARISRETDAEAQSKLPPQTRDLLERLGITKIK